jgi:hypothetical protein
MNEQFGVVQKLGCPRNEQFGAVQKLWRIENTDGAFIRVKNSEGATVVRTGVTTALVSIEKCSCVACPPQKRVRAPCLSRGVTPQLILAFRCNPP